jgi:hypothetical protein
MELTPARVTWEAPRPASPHVHAEGWNCALHALEKQEKRLLLLVQATNRMSVQQTACQSMSSSIIILYYYVF